MNSMSRSHDNDDKDCGCKKEKEAAQVLLKCRPSSSVTVIAAPITTPPAAATAVATVTLNTEKFNLPCIKFEIATNLVYTPGAVVPTTLNVTFQLAKLCRHQTVATLVGSPWVFVPATSTLNTTSSNIISFIVCECDCDNECDCDECCTYTLNATALTTGAGSTASLAFNNPTLSALVVDKTTRCCH